MMDVAGLVEFVRAQLDDDEAYARNAFGDHNQAEPEWTEIWSGAVQVGPHEDVVLTNDSQVSRHMVRHDPARVLRDVEADRLILAAHAEHPIEPDFCRTCGSTVGPCTTKRLLALRFADRPDYNEGWRP